MPKQPYTEIPYPSPEEQEEEAVADEVQDEPAPEPQRRWYFGSGMSKRIVGIVVAVLVVALLWYAWKRHAAGQLGDGSIKFDDTATKLTEASTPSDSAINTSSSTSDTPKTRNIVQPTTNVQPPLSGTAAPTTDSISPNPANGMVFSGSGKFQVYRQGNLTWRVDTESGHTCILFATMEEWRKPIVYQHGCNNS